MSFLHQPIELILQNNLDALTDVQSYTDGVP